MRRDFNKATWDNKHGYDEDYGSKKGRSANRPIDELPKFEPAKKNAVKGWGGKSHSSSFAIVRNFLRSRVGKKWNDVWAEVCRQNDGRSFLGWDTRKTFLCTVRTDTYEENGQIYAARAGGYVLKIYDGDFYVDSAGILRLYSENSKKKATYIANDVDIIIDKYCQYRKYNGIWYRVTLSDKPTTSYTRVMKEYGYLPWWYNSMYGLGDNHIRGNYIVYRIGAPSIKKEFILDDKHPVITKKQMNKKEISRIMKILEGVKGK